MSRDSAKAHYTKQPGDPDEGFITASDAQAAIDDIYDDMSAPAVIADGSVTSGKIAADAVGSAQIATGAVGSGELATDAVTSDKIADGAVSNAHVASDAAIAASKVAGTAVTQADTGTVTNGMLAGSIAKTKVAGTAITAADTGTVTGTMIAAGAVDNGNLAANAVNAAKIASGAVTTVKIADDAVTTAKIAADAVTSTEIAANAVGASELADNAVDTAAIAADAVTADKIANDTITAAELAANSVGTSELANDSVTAAKILDGTITANEIQNATITGAKLVNDTITATQIAADAIGSSELANNAVDTAAIQNDAVTADKIATNAVGSSELADSAVDTAAIADGAVTSAKIADGTITSTDVAASTFAAFGTVGNLLTANQASVETDSSPFGAFLNCTISRSTAHSVHGSACLKAVATADGPFIAGLGVESFPVVPGETITATFALKADREIVGVRVTIQWATGGSPGDLVYRTVTATTSWVTHSLTVVVPSGVETAGLFSWVTIHAAAGSEIYMDCFGVWKGAGGQWAMPGTPITGLSEQATNGAVHLSGTGTPEGVVTAAPGSTWLQTDATTDVKGWIRWVKATGTGNTGWVAGPEADTGRRNVVADIDADWAANASAGYIRLQRVGERVYFEARLDRVTASGSRDSYDAVYTVPSGFAPRNAYNIRGLAAGPSGAQGYVSDPGIPGRMDVWFLSGGTWAAGDDVVFTAEWYTNDSWPSSLPGSAI